MAAVTAWRAYMYIYIYVYIFIYRCEYACHTQWKCINKDSKELKKKNITSTKKQLCGTTARSGLLATAKLLLRCLGLQVVFSCHPECVVHPDWWPPGLIYLSRQISIIPKPELVGHFEGYSVAGKINFLFHRWDMLVPRRVLEHQVLTVRIRIQRTALATSYKFNA